MTRIFTAAFVCLLWYGSPAFAGSDAQKPTPPIAARYHPPRSAAEKELNEILRRSFDDNEMLSYILGAPEKNPTKVDAYTRLFTRELIDALSRAEAERVRQSCGGKYLEGELCGFDYVPTTCTQDWDSQFALFYTEKETSTEAWIWSKWIRDEGPPLAAYRVIFDKDHWKLDGIHCHKESDGFNMP